MEPQNGNATTSNTGSNQNSNTSNTNQTADWTSGLSDNHKGLLENKGFDTPAKILDSYISLEKHIGVPKERLLRLPEKESDVEGWNGIYDKLGRPKSADDYSLPENTTEDFAKWAKSAFHKYGLSKKQGESLVNEYVQMTQAQAEKMNQDFKDQIANQEYALKKEWGAAYDQNIIHARKAAKAFNIDADTVDKLESAMGYDKVMKFFSEIGSKVGEDVFVSNDNVGGGGFGVLTPNQALNRIETLKSDPEFRAKLAKGDADASAEWTKLHQMMAPE